MSFFSRIFLWWIVAPTVLSIVAYYGILVYEGYRDGLVPAIETDGWWAAEHASKSAESTEIKQLRVNVSEADLADLKARLKRAKFLENIVQDHTYGFRGDQLQQIRNYWLDKYDWRKWEREINEMNNYVTQIEGIDVHYALVQPAQSNADTITIVLLHGFPSTFHEFHKLAQQLVKPDTKNSYDGSALQFEVLIPSLPGYGWSEGAHKPGMNVVAVSRILLKLLARLNRRSYYIHGGDWGALVAQTMARLTVDKAFVPTYATEAKQAAVVVKGVHTNFPLAPFTKMSFWCKLMVAAYFPSLVLAEGEYKKMFPFESHVIDLINSTGYLHLQATRPDTVAAGLLDSPVGLAAYIMEKYSAWTDGDNLGKADGGLTEKFTLDELLTNVMIYWLTESIGSSVRLYKEAFTMTAPDVMEWFGTPLRVPVGIASFPYELISQPKWLVQDTYPLLLHYTRPPRGGHFPALEEPELLARSIREFVHVANAHWSQHQNAQS